MLQRNIDWKSPFLNGVGQFGPKFQVEGDVPINHSLIRKNRCIVLSYRIRMWAEFLSLCHNSHVWQTDRQMDRQTDRQTDRQRDGLLIARLWLHSCSTVKITNRAAVSISTRLKIHTQKTTRTGGDCILILRCPMPTRHQSQHNWPISASAACGNAETNSQIQPAVAPALYKQGAINGSY